MDNKPAQRLANAARAKMFRAVDAKRHHQKVADYYAEINNIEKLKIHVDMVEYFNKIANHYQKLSEEYGSL